MSNNIIISIDWDHTLRNMAGIDLNILALALYAKSKNIPVGLTTHRDMENTTLYTLYYWQYQKPKDNSDALAAALSYWDKHLFKPFNLEFDFINARYQSRYEPVNYYQTMLYPLEQELAKEITMHRILDNPLVVQEKIQEYAQAEKFINDNEFKETQLLWLSENFSHLAGPLTVYHIDDSRDVCQELPSKFSALSAKADIFVHTIFYENSPLFSNENSIKLIAEMGLLQDIQNFSNNTPTEELLDNQLKCLSLCLAVLQIPNLDNKVFSRIEEILGKINLILRPEITNLYRFVEGLLIETKTTGRPICILPNDLSFLYTHKIL